MTERKYRTQYETVLPVEHARKGLSDDELLDLVQRQTLRYFWDFGHPISGMARERSNPNKSYDTANTVTTGGTGFGIMAMLAGVERGWLEREEVMNRVQKITDFLSNAKSYHGVFPHFMNGSTGDTVAFSRMDDGGDIVETSFLMMGLLTARQYFDGNDIDEVKLRASINYLWEAVEWDWHAPDNKNLYWHWSETHDYGKQHSIKGWNECLITYMLAVASPAHPIDPDIYHKNWAKGANFENGNEYYGHELPLGPDKGGPLFFTHYSFLGVDPNGLQDSYADYGIQNRSHVLINRAHCIDNPNGYEGYGEKSWGLTACDGDRGYSAHSPTNDRGVIAPTAALASMPYAPEESMTALRYYFEEMGPKLWTEYGFADAFNESAGWQARSCLAIDQGPIPVMIENHRSGLLWKLGMSCPEIQKGLKTLGFDSPYLERVAKNSPESPSP